MVYQNDLCMGSALRNITIPHYLSAVYFPTSTLSRTGGEGNCLEWGAIARMVVMLKTGSSGYSISSLSVCLF